MAPWSENQGGEPSAPGIQKRPEGYLDSVPPFRYNPWIQKKGPLKALISAEAKPTSSPKAMKNPANNFILKDIFSPLIFNPFLSPVYSLN